MGKSYIFGPPAVNSKMARHNYWRIMVLGVGSDAQTSNVQIMWRSWPQKWDGMWKIRGTMFGVSWSSGPVKQFFWVVQKCTPMIPYACFLHARISKQSRADRTVPINATIIPFSRTPHKYAHIRFCIGSIKIVARPMGYHLVMKLGNGKSPTMEVYSWDNHV